MDIRLATIDDLGSIVHIEKECFPPREAATEETFQERLAVYPNHFWLLEKDAGIIGFANGMVTDALAITDEMFERAELHNENGSWQALFGLTILAEHRRNGYAAMIMKRVISDSRIQKRQGCILTCKDTLINYYQQFGFTNHGVSKSVHGGETWYDMRLEF